MSNSLFIGVFTTGLVYADKSKIINGDYKTIAYLPYGTLELHIRDEKSSLLPAILKDVEEMKAKKGEKFRISTFGITDVTLGSDLL
jgi:hypothetical protein